MKLARILGGIVLAIVVLLNGGLIAASAATQVPATSFGTPAAAGRVATAYRSYLWTGAQFGNANGKYNDNNISAHDGKLDIALKNGQGGYVAFDPTFKGTTYGRYQISVKSDGPGTGYGVAVLLWPKGDDARKGEVDLLEGDLDKHLHIYQHATGSNCRADGYCGNVNQVDYKTEWRDSGWHKIDTTWSKDRLIVKVDGKTKINTTNNIPVGPHVLIVQAAKKDGAKKVKNTHFYVGSVKIEQ